MHFSDAAAGISRYSRLTSRIPAVEWSWHEVWTGSASGRWRHSRMP